MSGFRGVEGVGQVSLLVRDADRATRFYAETLGVRHLYSYGDLLFFECGGVRLYLHRVPEDQWRPGSILYLTVTDIEAAHRELTARGIRFRGEPELVHRHESGVEEWMAFFEDGEGNQLALMARVP